MSEVSKPKKARIPKVVKDLSWNKWIGDDVAKHKCLCCEVNEIKMSSFHCGHIISEKNGGTITVDNLKPICSACNLSMGIENMDEFKKRCGFTSEGKNTPNVKPVAVISDTTKIPRKKVSAAPKMGKTEKLFQDKVNKLLLEHKIKPCPGKEERYMEIGSLFKRSPCSNDLFWKHCDSCGNHYHKGLNDFAMCPCRIINI